VPKFPDPPDQDRLQAIGPHIAVIPAGTPLARLYRRGGRFGGTWRDFRHWGPTDMRFDHHLPDPETGEGMAQARGILYAAGAHPPGALTICAAEVFQTTRVIDRCRDQRAFVVFETVRALRLLDLCGLWPTRAGTSAAIASGPRPRARRWSRAIHAAYPAIEGIWYPSSMGGGAPCAALFERAADALPAAPAFNRQLDDPALDAAIAGAALAIGYDLV